MSLLRNSGSQLRLPDREAMCELVAEFGFPISMPVAFSDAISVTLFLMNHHSNLRKVKHANTINQIFDSTLQLAQIQDKLSTSSIASDLPRELAHATRFVYENLQRTRAVLIDKKSTKPCTVSR